MEILFENNDIVAINKPAGVMTHGDGREQPQPTVADWFTEQYPDVAQVGEDAIETQNGSLIERPGIVHRLDRDTSGVLLLAKTDHGYAHLKQQFQDRTVKKTYTALVYGHMKKDTYIVDQAIGRAKTFGRWTAIPKAMRGTSREAQTEFAVTERFEKNGEPYSLVEARPKTGRTHQIRVHLQYLNYPIVADALYAGKRNNPEKNLGFDHQALHAKQIVFADLDDKEVTVVADVPDMFTI